MKKNLLLITGMFFVVLLMMSCEGPMGPAGTDGTDGINGTDGTNGVDGNMVCMQCHTLDNKSAVESEYHFTRHFNHTAVGYAGGRKDCTACHSHEGFVETQYTGMDTTANDISIPTAIGCLTCHDSHRTFDFESDGKDYALRTVDPVTFNIYPEHTIEFGSSSNLCVECHQPRRPAPVADDSGNFNVTSSHYGPHHAPNGTVLFGIGGYEFDGLDSYPAAGSSAHFTASCTGCHMGSAVGDAGGHTLIPTEASCITCHSNGVPDMKSEIEGLLENLKGRLQTAGILDAEGHVVTGEFPINVAGSFYNYALIEEDLSHGVHNPKYTRALLKNSIAKLQ